MVKHKKKKSPPIYDFDHKKISLDKLSELSVAELEKFIKSLHKEQMALVEYSDHKDGDSPLAVLVPENQYKERMLTLSLKSLHYFIEQTVEFTKFQGKYFRIEENYRNRQAQVQQLIRLMERRDKGILLDYEPIFSALQHYIDKDDWQVYPPSEK